MISITRHVKIFIMSAVMFNITCFSYLNDTLATPMKVAQSINSKSTDRGNIDLTDIWIRTLTVFAINSTGCTSTDSGTINGTSTNSDQEFAIIQKGNKLIFPTEAISWSSGINNGSYLLSAQGIVNGKKVKIIYSGNLLQGFTQEFEGTISNDGNTITGEIFCQAYSGTATTTQSFTWKRKIQR
jgi:hypothetical protein